MTLRIRSFAALVASLLLSFAVLAQKGQPASQPPSAVSQTLDMTVQDPESVGFSSQRLERLHAYMQRAVDDKQFAGIVTLLARHARSSIFKPTV